MATSEDLGVTQNICDLKMNQRGKNSYLSNKSSCFLNTDEILNLKSHKKNGTTAKYLIDINKRDQCLLFLLFRFITHNLYSRLMCFEFIVYLDRLGYY